MPLPSGLATVTVTGTLTDAAGNPIPGSTVTFAPPTFISDSTGNQVLSRSGVTVAADDTTGDFSVVLPASDSPDLNPTGFTYTVAIRMGDGQRDTLQVSLPAAVPSVNLADLVPVETSSGVVNAPALVASVNGRTGDVTGLAEQADLAAEVSRAEAAETTKQPLDPDLTALAELDPSTAGGIWSDGAGWVKKTAAQFKTALGLVKADVGLGNVDNISDVNKPISTATQTALDGKQPLDPDLTAIAALDSSTAGAIASDGAGWVKKTYAQFKTALGITTSDVSGLGTAATHAASDFTLVPTLTDTAVIYVAATGNDSNDGRTWATAFATFAAALTAAGLGPTTIKFGIGTFDFSSDVVLPQAVYLKGSGDPFTGQGTLLEWNGADTSSYAITTARAVSGADSTGQQIRNLRIAPAAAKPGGGAYAAKSGVNLRNYQNASDAERLQIQGFPGTGILLDGANGVTVPAAYPGFILLSRIWVTNCGVNWRFKGGFTSITLINCASDFGALTTDICIIDQPSSGTGKAGNYVFLGFKTEYNGSTDTDVNFFTVNADVGMVFIGSSARKSTGGTKPWINYTVTPGSTNTPTGTIPVTLVNCHTQDIPITVQGPTGAALLSPPVTGTGGEVYQIALWSGQGFGTSPNPLTASLLTSGEETVSRSQVNNNGNTLSSQVLRLAYFTARKTETISQLAAVTAGTAAGATPTLCRMGLFTVAANGDLTLVASTPNDTTLFAATQTTYAKALSASYTLTQGVRYAAGLLVVTAATAPTIHGCSVFSGIGNATEMARAPALTAHVNSQTDLANVAHGNLLYGDVSIPYVALLP